MTIIGGLVYKKSMIFEVFGTYLSDSLIFLPSSCDKHQSLIMGALVTQESLTSGKNFMIVHPVVSEILGGRYHPPPDASKLSKIADTIRATSDIRIKKYTIQ